MINLELLDACQNCPDLDPIKTGCVDIMCRGEVVDRRSTITCSCIDKCKVLLEHLKKEVNKNGR